MNFIAILVMTAAFSLYDGEIKPVRPVEQPPKYSLYELQTLFRCIEAEEHGNSYECKYMAASCVVNRANNWGLTLDEVIYQRNQFEVVLTGAIDWYVPEVSTVKACMNALEHPDPRVMYFSMGNKHWRFAKLITIIDGEYFYE